MVSGEIGAFVGPVRVLSRDDVLSRPSPVQSRDGVYGWWFRPMPPLLAASGCCQGVRAAARVRARKSR